jgi:hypothetical protein
LKQFIKIYFVYTGIYIAAIATLAAYSTVVIADIQINNWLFGFIFCAAIASYTFHWAWHRPTVYDADREQWSIQNKKLLFTLSTIAIICSSYIFSLLPKDYWLHIAFATLITGLYTAPKIPYPPFIHLRSMVRFKTVYLSAAWVYVVVCLPLLAAKVSVMPWAYIIHKWAFLLAICLLFDYKDRVVDNINGIKSILAFFSAPLISIAVQLIVSISIVGLVNSKDYYKPIALCLDAIPTILLLLMYKKAIASKSEWLYYIILDGLIGLAGLLLWIYIVTMQVLK